VPDALDLLKTRRSVAAAFLGPPAPSKAELADILTVAIRVPDHGKLTPWRFIVFAGEARREVGSALAALFKQKNPDADDQQIEAQENKLAQAPLVIAVVSKAAPHPKIPEWEQLLSAGNAAMGIVLASHALGYAANWTTGWIAYDTDAKPILGLEPDEKLIATIHIGTPTAPPTDRPRPSIDDVVTYWKAPGTPG
jgi:nitroreductase